MTPRSPIRLGHSRAPEPRLAVREFHAAVVQDDPALVLFFCSNEYDRDELADELRRQFGPAPLVGCTTAGEIGPEGYCSRSLSGVSFARESFSVATGLVDHLQAFQANRCDAVVQEALGELEAAGASTDPAHAFGLILVDGLSLREEVVARTLKLGLGRIPLFGGSAGDGTRFANAQVYHGGRFHDDGAVLAVVSTGLPFTVFKTQHFVALDERLVVTEADPSRRIVHEINGRPAAVEYARCVGTTVDGLDPLRFAGRPFVVVIEGSEYVRSVQRVNPDGSLTFYCAIDEGVILRPALGADLVSDLSERFRAVEASVGEPQLVIACDCILRAAEVAETGATDQVAALLTARNAVGFSTYGETFGGFHMNQTLTGIAIGSPAEARG